MKLYHYVHCPFCVRVRMAAGYLSMTYDSIVLPYDDEETPIKLMNKKMLPIMDFGENVSNESLDIIKMMDKQNSLSNELFSEEIDKVLSEIGSNVHSLAMPYWIWTPEFDNNSRSYFQTKKEVKRGPFKNLVKKQDEFIEGINQTLKNVEEQIQTFYQSERLTILDVVLASHLWGLYVVPEYQFSNKMHEYLQRVKKLCKFNYHEDFWK